MRGNSLVWRLIHQVFPDFASSGTGPAVIGVEEMNFNNIIAISPNFDSPAAAPISRFIHAVVIAGIAQVGIDEMEVVESPLNSSWELVHFGEMNAAVG